jgi:hypothetical protein
MQVNFTITIDDNEVLNLIERLRELSCLFADETYAVEDVRAALEKFIQNEAEAITADLDHYAHEIHAQSELELATVQDLSWEKNIENYLSPDALVRMAHNF